MDLREIKVLVSRGGGQYLEFKKKANYTEKIVKEVVTFVNSERGQLLLGVDDEGMADCFNTAYSYVVFPSVGKSDSGVGGALGHSVVYQGVR